MTDRLLLSVAEAAAMTGMSSDHLRRHAPVVRVGRRVLVPVAWVEGLAHHRPEEVRDGTETVGEWQRVPQERRAVGGADASPGRDDRHRDQPQEPRRGSRQGEAGAVRVTVYDFGGKQ